MDELRPMLPSNSPPPPTWWERTKKALGPFGVVLVVIAKFFAKLKFLLYPILKFGWPVLKTGGTMLLSIWVYTQAWGWRYAVGFVLLIFVHECGHLIVARFFGLKVGAPMFIPFMGAFIALKDAPRDAWMEACVGIGGPLLGALGAAACAGAYLVTGDPLWRALANSGFLLNLFNLAPIGFLDGGRIVTVISPWLWIVGLVVLVAMIFQYPRFLLIMILVLSLPRVWSLFRAKTDEEKRYFEATPTQRWSMGLAYFGLAALLAVGMEATQMNAGQR